MKVLHRPILLFLLLLTLGACGGDAEISTFEDRWKGAKDTAAEAARLKRAGEALAAAETFRRAHDRLVALLPDAPAEPGEGPSRVDVLTELSFVAVEVGEAFPDFLGRALRYAWTAVRESGGRFPRAWFNLGAAYSHVGMHELAVETIDEGISILPPSERDAELPRLLAALYNRGVTILRSGRLGAQGEAYEFLMRAWELREDAEENMDVFRILAELETRFQEEVNVAREENDELELARIHARYGLTEEAWQFMARARNQLGLTPEVRWTEARYVCEMSDEESWAWRALELYDEMIGRGERIGPASAGWARIQREFGEPKLVIERFGADPEPVSELREELVLSHIDMARSASTEEEVDAAFASARQLLLGGIDPRARGDILMDMGRVAGERERPEALRKVIQEFQRRYPRDLRVLVLDARLQELSGTPLVPGGGGENGG